MGWDKKFVDFGVVKIDKIFNVVKVYRKENVCVRIRINEPVTNATWVGDELNITLSNGKVSRYRDQNNHVTV
jgi:hypothetical protein